MSSGTAPQRSRASSQTRRSKDWGREVENQAKRVLAKLGFKHVKRTGSVAYTKAAADLEQIGDRPLLPPVSMVVTKDKGAGNPLLITMSDADLAVLLSCSRADLNLLPLRVQVKGRANSWIGRLWRELKEADRV